jgi:hypothetical protein
LAPGLAATDALAEEVRATVTACEESGLFDAIVAAAPTTPADAPADELEGDD